MRVWRLGAVLMLSRLASEWTEGLSGSVTVQLLPSAQISPDDQMNEALQAGAASGPACFKARALDRAEAEKLLEPWLGEGSVLEDLPVPQLIEVTLTPGPVEVEGLGRALADGVPGAHLDDHQALERGIGGVCRRRRKRSDGRCLLLIAVATLAIVIFATQAGLQAHREIVEVVHMIGARDVFIANEFQRHFLWLGVRGGIYRVGACGRDACRQRFSDGSREAPVGAQYAAAIRQLALHYTWLLFVPAMMGLIAMWTARLTVLRVLGRMP